MLLFDCQHGLGDMCVVRLNGQHFQTELWIYALGNHVALWPVNFWPDSDHLVLLLDAKSSSNYLHGVLLRYHYLWRIYWCWGHSVYNEVLGLPLLPSNRHDPVYLGFYRVRNERDPDELLDVVTAVWTVLCSWGFIFTFPGSDHNDPHRRLPRKSNAEDLWRTLTPMLLRQEFLS